MKEIHFFLGYHQKKTVPRSLRRHQTMKVKKDGMKLIVHFSLQVLLQRILCSCWVLGLFYALTLIGEGGGLISLRIFFIPPITLLLILFTNCLPLSTISYPTWCMLCTTKTFPCLWTSLFPEYIYYIFHLNNWCIPFLNSICVILIIHWYSAVN